MALEMGEYMSTLKIAAPYSQVNSDNSQQGPFSFNPNPCGWGSI
jgi:hypothetical protein